MQRMSEAPQSDNMMTAREGALVAEKATEEHLGTATAEAQRVLAAAGSLPLALVEYEKAFKRLHETLADLRTSRMTLVQEAAHILPALREVREFFLGSDYEKERARLADFLDLCERLKVLRESGFLDDIADTLLKLAR